MPVLTRIKSNLYKDSVALMRVAESILKDPVIRRATLVMGTPANKEILGEAGMLGADAAMSGPSDLIIALEGDDAARLDAAFDIADAALSARASDNTAGVAAIPSASLAMALDAGTAGQLVQISVPGAYAGAEALKAVKAGLDVFLFSDNVPLEQEREIKRLARRHGRLVMGPDCGTAIVAGVPLGFANVVRRGGIGLVGASGTGLQEVCCQIHLMGEGVSHALGTGGRDVKAEIGGLSMLTALEMLAGDAETRVIGLVSKPPAPEVMREVLRTAERTGKPVVACFLGGSHAEVPANVSLVSNLEECATLCVTRMRGTPAGEPGGLAPARPAFSAGQRHLRALFSGGTFCTEAQVILRDLGLDFVSNVPLASSQAIADSAHSTGHTLLDLGDDEFTVGRPHPMIDPSQRVARLAQEARDASVAVILVDVVLGYAGHMDPAGALVEPVRDAIRQARTAGRELAVIAFVCGTEGDPQGRADQERKLRDAGAIVCASSTRAARAAAAMVAGR